MNSSGLVSGRSPLPIDDIVTIAANTPGFFLCQDNECLQALISPARLQRELWGDAADCDIIRSGDMSLSCRFYGKGSDTGIVLLHGMRDSKHLMSTLATDICRRFPVVTIDFRGHGLSDKPVEPYSTRLLMEDLHFLLHRLPFRRIILAGHSLGASVALEWALNDSPLLSGLVLMGASVANEHSGYRPVNPEQMIKDKTPARHKNALEFLSGIYFPSSSSPERHRLRLYLRERMILTWLMFEEALALELVRMQRTDLSDRLNKISVPSLLISGEKDPVGKIEQTRFLKERLPECMHIQIEDTSHYMFLEEPEKVAESICTFTESLLK